MRRGQKALTSGPHGSQVRKHEAIGTGRWFAPTLCPRQGPLPQHLDHPGLHTRWSRLCVCSELTRPDLRLPPMLIPASVGRGGTFLRATLPLGVPVSVCSFKKSVPTKCTM